MGTVTKIQWCDHTFNPWIGCAKVHAGCTNCYAEADMDKRRGRVKWGANGTRSVTSEANWKKPLKWNAEAKASGVRKRVFCASLADVFEDWQGPIVNHRGERMSHIEGACEVVLTMTKLRIRLFALIDATPHLDWMLLTKRPENIRRMWPDKSGMQSVFPGMPGPLGQPMPCVVRGAKRLNVWLGTSVSDQETADKMIPELLKCRNLATVLFVSAEPLLGPMDLLYPPSLFPNGPQMCCDGRECGCRGMPIDPWPWFYPKGEGIDWLIIGGESGHNARPCNVSWVRSLVGQCKEAGVAPFVKQLGARPCDGKVGDRWSYGRYPRDPKGGDPDEWPEDLQVREVPRAAHIQ